MFSQAEADHAFGAAKGRSMTLEEPSTSYTWRSPEHAKSVHTHNRTITRSRSSSGHDLAAFLCSCST